MLGLFQKIKPREVFSLGVIILLLVGLTSGVYLVQKRQEIRKKAAESEQEPGQPSKPEYVEGEAIIKIKNQKSKIKIKEEKKALGVDIEKGSVEFGDLDQGNVPAVLKTINQKYKIEKIEKVFKGAEEPQKELAKFKQKFSKEISEGKRKINEKELLKIDLSRTYKIAFGQKESLDQVIGELSTSPEVEYAEPNYIYRTQVIPNDPEFPRLWGLNNTGQTGGKANADINAPEAWDIATGSSDIVVGVIDTGIDYNHPDLMVNIWTNPSEIPGNGIDDDNNGYIDDVRGWNFVANNNNPMDDNGHGTHVAGTIAAVGDNTIGVVGVAWRTKVAPLKFLDSAGAGDNSSAAQAVDYATKMGFRITNNSWGGGGYSKTLYDAISRADFSDTLFIAAAGNGGRDRVGDDNDLYPEYPAGFNLPNIVAVAATDHNDALTSFSNYGALSVDVAAPGGDIYSTIPNSSYEYLSGTSMATPHVAGLASLILSKDGSLSNLEVKTLIEHNSDKVGFANPIKSGRINAGNTLNSSLVPPVGEIILPELRSYLWGTVNIIGTVGGRSFSSYRLEVGQGINPVSWTTQGVVLVNGGTQPITNNVLATVNTTSYQKGVWILKLTVNGNNGLVTENKVLVRVPSVKIELGENVKVNDSNKEDVHTPRGVINGNNYYAVWSDFRNGNNPDIYFSKSNKDGGPFTPNQLVSSPQTEKDAFYPETAIVNDTLYLAFESAKEISGTTAPEEKIVIKKSLDQGNTFQLASILDIVGMQPPKLPGRFMEIKIDTYTEFLYLTWQAGNPQNDNIDVYFSRFNTRTNEFEDTKIIQTVGLDDQEIMPQPSIVIDNEGTIYMAWTQKMLDGWVKIQIVKSLDHGKSFSTPQSLFDPEKVTTPRYPQLVIDKKTQHIYIVFSAQTPVSFPRDVWVSRSTNKAKTFSDPINVTQNYQWEVLFGSYYRSAVAINDKGLIFVSWVDAASSEVYLATISESFSEISDPIKISPPSYYGIIISTSLVPTGNGDVFVLYDFGNEFPDYHVEWQILSRLVHPIELTSSPTPTPIPSIPPLPYPQSCPQSSPAVSMYAGYVYINSQPALPDTPVWAVNPRGQIVGCQKINSNESTILGLLPFMPVYGEDPTANPPIPGMRDNEPITFYISESYALSDPTPLIWHDDKDSHLVTLYVGTPLVLTPTPMPTSTPTPTHTLTPTPTLSETPNPNFGKMVQFKPPGSTTCSFIKVMPSDKLLMGKDFTIELWFRPREDILLPERAGSGLFSLLAKEGLSGGGWGAYNIFIALPQTLNETFHLQKTDGSYALGQGLIADPNILQPGQWYFFKLVKQGNTISQYINGNSVGTVTFSESEILTERYLNPLYIGIWKPLGSSGCLSSYKGDMDELRISDIARTNDPIPIRPFESDTNTLALYHFDGNADDASGNNHHGIESGVEYLSYPLSTVYSSSWLIPGDLTCDGYVDTKDLAVLLALWSPEGPVPTLSFGVCRSPDLSGGPAGAADGKVGESDYNVVLNNWNPHP